MRLLIPKPYVERDTVNDDIYIDYYTRVYGSLISGNKSRDYPIRFWIKKSLFNLQKYGLDVYDVDVTRLLYIPMNSVNYGNYNSYLDIKRNDSTNTHYGFIIYNHQVEGNSDNPQRLVTVRIYLQE